MGTIFSILEKLAFGNVEKRVLLVGLDGAGKTTLLHKLKLNETVRTVPTLGFNIERIEYKKITFTVWDIGGQEKIRDLWHHYYQNSNAVIFVVDSNDQERISDCKKELETLLSSNELENAVFLILANKQDLPNAIEPSALTEMLSLPNQNKRPWLVIGTCATNGSGLFEALDWLSKKITK